jgi:hypothetical protein
MTGILFEVLVKDVQSMLESDLVPRAAQVSLVETLSSFPMERLCSPSSFQSVRGKQEVCLPVCIAADLG